MTPSDAVAERMQAIAPVLQTTQSTLDVGRSTSSAGPSASGYAQPISSLWQKTPSEWVAKLHAVADAQDRAAERKQMNLEARAQVRQSIMVIIIGTERLLPDWIPHLP